MTPPTPPVQPFLFKAQESLVGAESEFASGRYNNCANRCYYACFQAAVHALREAGVQPGGRSGQWGHDFVQAEFVGRLINRRKVYPADLRGVLGRTLALREVADYGEVRTTEKEMTRNLRHTRSFVQAIIDRQGV